MSGSSDLWSLLPEPIRDLPADLTVVLLVVTGLNSVLLIPRLRGTAVQIALGLPFVLFLPGYALTAALFPGASQSVTDSDGNEGGQMQHRVRISTAERAVLSVGASVIVTPLVGLLLNETAWGIRPLPVLTAISVFTVTLTAIAAVRRWQLPEDKRFRVPVRRWFATGKSETLKPDSKVHVALNLFLVVSVLLAFAGGVYAVTSPKQGETFSEFYVLTENETGYLVADGYPEEITRGESADLVVGIENHEHERSDYTVVILLQRIDPEDRTPWNDTTVSNGTVLESEELHRFHATLGHSETWHRKHTVKPSIVGEKLRLTYLLYKGTPPDDPTVENAYRELHLWIDVTEDDVTEANATSSRPPPSDDRLRG